MTFYVPSSIFANEFLFKSFLDVVFHWRFYLFDIAFVTPWRKVFTGSSGSHDLIYVLKWKHLLFIFWVNPGEDCWRARNALACPSWLNKGILFNRIPRIHTSPFFFFFFYQVLCCSSREWLVPSISMHHCRSYWHQWGSMGLPTVFRLKKLTEKCCDVKVSLK